MDEIRALKTQTNPRRSTRFISSDESMNKKKNQPLSDISNKFNLIPTSTLRKLCFPSANSSSAAGVSKPRNVIRKPLISKSDSDSNSSKAFDTLQNNNSKHVVSETSFSSSNSNTVQLQNANAVGLSTTPSGRGNELVVYSQGQAKRKSNLGVTPVRCTSSLHDKKKEKGKSIFESSPPKSAKKRGKAIAEPFNICPPVTKEDKREGVVELPIPVSKNKKKKGIDEPLTSLPSRSAKHKTMPSDETTVEEKSGALSQNCPPLKKTRGKGKADSSVFSCPPLPKTRTNRIELNGAGGVEPSGSRTDPNPMRRKRRYTGQQADCALPQEFINYWQEHYKEVDEFELPEEEVSYSDLD